MDVEDREIRARSNSRCDYRKSAYNATEMSFLRTRREPDEASLTTDHARNCLYAHVHKSIHQMVAYLEQLALYNHHEYIIAQTYLIVCACDVTPNITSLFCRDVSELLWHPSIGQESSHRSRRGKKLSMTRAQQNGSRSNAFSMHYFSTRASCQLAASICRGVAASGAPNTAR